MTMTKAAKAIAKGPKKRVFYPQEHECFMDCSDQRALMDNANDLVAFPKLLPNKNEAPSSIQLRFAEGGDLSFLQVWSADGKRFFGGLNGRELFLFIARVVARMDDHNWSNSPSMRGPLYILSQHPEEGRRP
jgi:hypothetical protein